MAPSSLQGLNLIDFGDAAGGGDEPSGLPPDLAAHLDFLQYMHFSHEDDRLPFGGLGHPKPGAATLDDLVRLGEEELATAGSSMEQQSAGPGGSEGATVPGDFGRLFTVDPFLVAPSPSLSTFAASEASPPAPKKPRARKGSDATPRPGSPPPSDTPVTAAEDKRRRNTAASARFRAKKKEREAALETRSKELEVRVGELERECEALRRENGWLKGLVVGVTQAGSSASAADHIASVGVGKRKRESAA